MMQSFPPPRGSMEKALELLSSETSVAHEDEPRLNLLVEREPAHEIFFSNLIHTFRPAPAVRSSAPGELWHDVFLPTSLPWKSFQESLLWHFVVIFAGWALSQGWASRPQPHVRQTYRAAEALYYTPPKTAASARNSPPKAKLQPKAQTASRAHGPGAMSVAAEQRGTPKLVVPPDLKLAEGPRAPNLGSSNSAMPSVPISATARAQAALKGFDGALAPPPDVSGRMNQPGGLAQAAVAPPADLAALGGRRSLHGPGARVVEPPPSVQGSGRSLGSLGASGQVVAPPPQLPGQGLRAGLGAGPRALASGASGVVAPPPSVEHQGRAGMVSGPGVAVVPPPPAMQGAGIRGGVGRAGSPGGVASEVVPPPPAVQSGGGVMAALTSFFGGSSKVVPPPPSVQGAGAGAGSGDGSRMGSLGGSAVPPPPAMQAGGGTGRGRITSLGTGGSEIVPPPPTVSGAGGAATGRGGLGGSLSGGGSSVVAPPPSLAGMGNGSGVGSGGHGLGGALSGNGTEVVPPPPSLQGSGSGTGFGGGNGAGAGNQFGSLAGTGTGVVPPPPGLQGTGNGSRGHGGGLVAGGDGVIAPPPSLGGGGGAGGNGSGGNGGNGTGSSGRGFGDLPGGNLGAGAPPAGTGSASTGPLEQMEPLTDDASASQMTPSARNNGLGPAEDIPLRFIAIPGAYSKTSFFSNYEVVIAERTVNAQHSEYIKLVYVSLPYQRRLSDYNWNTTRIYKLRATHDPKCDESLMEMMFPEGGDQLDEQTQADANRVAAQVGDKNTKLQCYETTADDFERAISRSH